MNSPTMMDSLFHTLDDFRQNIRDWCGGAASSYCRLNTADEESILIADDASMVSRVRLSGSLRLIGAEEFETVCERLSLCLKTPLTNSGHAIQFVYQYDPLGSDRQLQRHFEPIRAAAKTLRLDLDDVLQDWKKAIAGYCAVEETWIAVWTRPFILPRSTLQNEKKARKKRKAPQADAAAQSMTIVIERMRNTHWAVVNDIRSTLDSLKYQAEIVDSHTALREIRALIAPAHTSSDWRPYIPGDPLPLRARDRGVPETDMTPLLYPSLKSQLWPTEAIVEEMKYVEIDNMIFAPFMLTLPPQQMKPFNALFRAMIGERMPWRVSFLLTGDGMRGQSLKSVASGILSFTSLNNRLYNKAYDALDAAQANGECAVLFQGAFCTWVDKHREQHPLQTLSQQAARLSAAVQSWGSSDTSDLIGDPLLGVTATLPAMLPASPSPAAVAPLSQAVRLLPLGRPTSPWTATDSPIRSPEGRYMPTGLFSSNMASWNEICFAGMGAGKSFFLNTLNFFFCIRPGQTRLPWLTIIDIGISSSGLINLLRSALPEDMKHLAVFARLRNTPDAAVNPFDLPLGCPTPLPNHLDYLINLTSLLCTPLDKTAPVDGVIGLLREAIDTAYRDLSPKESNPRKYNRHTEPEIQQTLESLQFVCDSQTTWWEVVEALFDAGEIAAAVRAQRQAVPLLTDIAVACNQPLLAEQYNHIISSSGETIPQACSRYITDAIRSYPLLANPTKFDLGAAQIIALDLQEVTPRSGPAAERQAGIMYMMARFVGAAHFFNTVDDLLQIPEHYRDYHRERFEHLAADPKRLCYDEFHRASCANLDNPLTRQIISDLTTASRESRKQNLSIGLYSQVLNDFPRELVDLATSIYVL